MEPLPIPFYFLERKCLPKDIATEQNRAIQTTEM